MFAFATAAIIITILMSLIRAFWGPTVFDRIQAANMIGTKVVLLIAVTGFLTGRPEWMDLAVLYALMNFIGVLAVLRFSSFGSLARNSRFEREGDS